VIEKVRDLASREAGLAVVLTYRADGTGQASVVNAGVIGHPDTGEHVVAFVSRGGARKLSNLRARPGLLVVFRSGWEWMAVEGSAEIVGPAGHDEGPDRSAVLSLVRQIYAAAVGGAPEDWAELDDVFVTEGHTAVLVHPRRVYSNPES
jgi:hypothetical protein